MSGKQELISKLEKFIKENNLNYKVDNNNWELLEDDYLENGYNSDASDLKDEMENNPNVYNDGYGNLELYSIIDGTKYQLISRGASASFKKC